MPIRRTGELAMSKPAVENLTEIVHELSHWHRSLLMVLEEEHEQLRTLETEGLVHTITRKAAILEQLRAATERLEAGEADLARPGCLQPAGFPPGHGLHPAPTARLESLHGSWQDLLRVAWRVKQLQQSNQAMIEEGLGFCEDALSCLQRALTGQAAAYASVHKVRTPKPEAVRLRREV
jgi:flagellar biosynthesis/type III secretory pathway chaperone